MGVVPLALVTGEHRDIARCMVGESEIVLADPSAPSTLELAIACTRTGYDTGRLYLEALHARDRASLYGSALLLMRCSRLTARLRRSVASDAARTIDF
jgi:hypothetical protein